MSAAHRPPHPSQPVLWWQLITEAEAIREAHGLGLANVWAHIHREDYQAPREALDGVRAYVDRRGMT